MLGGMLGGGPVWPPPNQRAMAFSRRPTNDSNFSVILKPDVFFPCKEVLQHFPKGEDLYPCSFTLSFPPPHQHPHNICSS